MGRTLDSAEERIENSASVIVNLSRGKFKDIVTLGIIVTLLRKN